MLVTGDIKCLHCGYISGQWIGRKGSPLTASGLRNHSLEGDSDTPALLHCGRCEGPVFLDDASLVISSYRLRRIRRLRDQIAALDAHRAA